MPFIFTMPNGAYIYKAEITDTNEIADVVRTSMERIPEAEKMEEKAVEEMVTHLFTETKERLIFKAVLNDKIQGVIGCEIDEDDKETCNIHFLSTREKCQGYGTALENFMRNHVLGLGVNEIVIKEHPYSGDFFKKLGYAEFDAFGKYSMSLEL